MSYALFNELKVIELASVLAGPSVGQFFAELGAEVVKVENPNTQGDVTRSWKSKAEQTDDVSAYFSSINWGKKSLALNYGKPKGLEVLYKLVEQSDLVITSFKPGDAEKLKVSFDDLKKVNPQIIYGSITGYGDDDPRVGYDAVIQAESGFLSINGEKGGEPLKMPVALMDVLAGHQLKEALLLAYIRRLKTGEAQKVSVSLIDAALSSLVNQAANWLVGGNIPERSGSLHPNIAPYGEVFTTKDRKQIILAVGSDKQFNQLLLILGLENSEHFQSNTDRVKNRSALFKILQMAIGKWEGEPLIALLHKNNIPAGEIRSIKAALEKYADVVISSEPWQGVPTFIGKMEGLTKSSHFLPPPHFNQHEQEILVENLGLSAEKQQLLRSEGILPQ